MSSGQYKMPSAEANASRTFDNLKRNPKRHGFNTTHIPTQNFQWLLPAVDWTQEQLKIFCTLRDFPLIVSNGNLSRVVELEPSTMTSPSTPFGQYFYLRSWELITDQLQKVMEFMAGQDILLSEAVRWEETLIIHNIKTIFTIRYIGTVGGLGRPIDQQIKNLASERQASGVLLEFVAAIEQLFPETAAAIYSADDIERVLIEFFDPRSLLNRILGNSYISFVPFAEDVALFEKLHTHYCRGFVAEALDIRTDPPMTVALFDHFEEIQTYANSNPTFTGTIQHRSTDRTRRHRGKKNPGASLDPRAFAPRHIASANFWPWLWHPRTTLDAAIHLTRQYLSIVRPLFVATCSRTATALVRSNFQSEDCVPYGLSLSAVVGEVTIEYYGSEGDEDSAFLAIPQIDPGLEKYVGFNLSQILLRFMDLTWQTTLHAADEARKLLDEDHAQGMTRTRKVQCIEILRSIQHLRTSDPDMRSFMESFKIVGNELRSAWSRMHHRPDFGDFRPLPDEED
ncbi:hypothetical protein KCU65_g9840, partial [Aureobasidium melanogenum]